MDARQAQASGCRDLDTPLPSIGDARSVAAARARRDRRSAASRRRRRSATRMRGELARRSAGVPRAARARSAEDVCPYRGLAAFGEDDAKYFFGRSNEIRTALAQLDEWPLLAVIGPSGVGKSSFVHAGLVPGACARPAAPGRSACCARAACRCTGLASIARRGDRDRRGRRRPDGRGSREAPGLFGDAAAPGGDAQEASACSIVVDQLEELFTLCDSDRRARSVPRGAARRRRRSELAGARRAVDARRLPRSPRRPQALPRRAVARPVLPVRARSRQPARDARAARRARRLLVRGPTASSTDMMQAATSRGALPLLQFAATRLWDARDRTAQAADGRARTTRWAASAARSRGTPTRSRRACRRSQQSCCARS